MASLRAALHSEIHSKYKLEEMVTKLNAFVHRSSALNSFITFFFCEINKIPLAKPKYLVKTIADKDKNFIRIYNSIAKSLSVEEKTRKISGLAQYCLKLTGGKLPKKWEIKQRLN